MNAQPTNDTAASAGVGGTRGRARQRQVEAEGYTSAHDREHEGDLWRAATCYATPASHRVTTTPALGTDENGQRFRAVIEVPVPFDWPWSAPSWKPTPNDRVRELVKAGALIAAEIDRLQR